jgi:hypothetical protein
MKQSTTLDAAVHGACQNAVKPSLSARCPQSRFSVLRVSVIAVAQRKTLAQW